MGRHGFNIGSFFKDDLCKFKLILFVNSLRTRYSAVTETKSLHVRRHVPIDSRGRARGSGLIHLGSSHEQ